MSLSASFYERHIKPRERPAVVTGIGSAPRFVRIRFEDESDMDGYFCGRRPNIPLLQLDDRVSSVPPMNPFVKAGVFGVLSSASEATTALPQFRLDGNSFECLEGFYDRIEEILCPGFRMGRHLDALDDVLVGGLTEAFLYCESIELLWTNSEKSRRRLGYGPMIELLTNILQHCHPSNDSDVERRLNAARNKEGPTLFDWLTEIIRDNPHVRLNQC